MKINVAVTVALVLAVSGCGGNDDGEPVDLRPENVVGTWQGDPGRTFVFTGDGTFTATDLPARMFDTPDPEGAAIDGSGLWRLSSPIEDPEKRRSVVHLNFRLLAGKDVNSSGPSLDARGERLFFFYDGGWYAYAKLPPA